MLQEKFVEEIKTHILCSLYFFSNNLAVYELMWKRYDTAREATDDNIIWRREDAICMRNSLGKNTDTLS
jgi:hypothetical protein